MPNADTTFRSAVSTALRRATSLVIDDVVIRDCVDPNRWHADTSFLRAWQDGLRALPVTERVGRLSGATGHIGESVAEVLLDALGYDMLWHFTAAMSGGHGVDLLVASPAGQVVAVEVKSTLRPQRWPRPTAGELQQLSPEWLDKDDNPGMAELGLTGGDVYGAVVVVNLAERKWRCAVTADFTTAHPVLDAASLGDLSWTELSST